MSRCIHNDGMGEREWTSSGVPTCVQAHTIPQHGIHVDIICDDRRRTMRARLAMNYIFVPLWLQEFIELVFSADLKGNA